MELKTPARCAIALLLVVLAGCSEKKPEPSASAPPQPSESARAPESVPPAAPAAEPVAKPLPPTRSAAPPAEVVPQATGKEPAPFTPSPVAAPEVKPEPARIPEPTPAPVVQSAPQKPAAPEIRKAAPKDVVVLTGSPMGGVRLEHKLHVERAGNKCETCHHASRPEKPATAPQQACSTCHTKVAVPPMTTKYQAAFHNPMAQAGTCVDCHKAQNLKGKKAPLKCPECHKKENA